MRHSRHQSRDSPIAHGGPLHSTYSHYSPEVTPHHTRQMCHGRIVICGRYTLRQVFLTDSEDNPRSSSSDATAACEKDPCWHTEENCTEERVAARTAISNSTSSYSAQGDKGVGKGRSETESEKRRGKTFKFLSLFLTILLNFYLVINYFYLC